MGKCSDCYIFVKLNWDAGCYDKETEEPKEPCFIKEPIKKED